MFGTSTQRTRSLLLWAATPLLCIWMAPLIPQEQITNVDGVASMMHMMNANSFTCGVYHMAAGADAAAFADTMKNVVLNNQWMCGFPETLVIANIAGEYVLVAFGINDAMNPFQTNFAAAYPEAQVLVNEPIA